MTDVVAALITKDGKFLIGQRPAHKARGLLWEFVGGKIEKGESPQQALRREVWEELGVMIQVGDIFQQVTHTYEDITVRLTLYWATISEGEPQKREHEALCWVTASEMAQYPFCPADQPILENSLPLRRKRRDDGTIPGV